MRCHCTEVEELRVENDLLREERDRLLDDLAEWSGIGDGRSYFRRWQANERKLAKIKALADSWDPPVTTELLQQGFQWDKDVSDMADDLRRILDE